MWASVPHNDVALTRMTASCGPGVGSGQLVAVSPGCDVVLISACIRPLYPSHGRLPNAQENTGCATVGGLGRMPFMLARLCRTLTGVAVLISVAVLSTATPLFPASPPSSPFPRWARFELHQQDSDGDLQTGKPLTLMITLGGVPAGTVPIVAL